MEKTHLVFDLPGAEKCVALREFQGVLYLATTTRVYSLVLDEASHAEVFRPLQFDVTGEPARF